MPVNSERGMMTLFFSKILKRISNHWQLLKRSVLLKFQKLPIYALQQESLKMEALPLTVSIGACGK